MRTILVLNSKGGSGKTTIATNLAAHYAKRGDKVALVDMDPQGSSSDWLYFRPESRPPIIGIEGWDGGYRLPRRLDVAVIDARAGVHGDELAALTKRAETLLMPVLPSPIDIRAAERFVEELNLLPQVNRGAIRVGTVINRARENSPGRIILEDYLRHVRLENGHKLPYVGVLRASQNYLNAAERGLGIFEVAPSATAHDVELWQPILRWLHSKRSLPAK